MGKRYSMGCGNGNDNRNGLRATKGDRLRPILETTGLSKLESYIRGDIPVERILPKGKRAERLVKLREKRLMEKRQKRAESLVEELLDARKRERKNANGGGQGGSIGQWKGSPALYPISEGEEDELELVSNGKSRAQSARNERQKYRTDASASITPKIKSSCERSNTASSSAQFQNHSAKEPRNHSVVKSQDHSVVKSQDHSVVKSLDHSVVKSLDHSVVKSLDHSVVKSQDHSDEKLQDHSVEKSPNHTGKRSQNHLAAQSKKSKSHLVAEVQNHSIAESRNHSNEKLPNDSVAKSQNHFVAQSQNQFGGKSQKHSAAKSQNHSVEKSPSHDAKCQYHSNEKPPNHSIANSQNQLVAKSQNQFVEKIQDHSEQNLVMRFAVGDVSEAERLRVEVKYLKKMEAHRASVVKKCEAIARSFYQQNEQLRRDNERISRELTRISEQFRSCGQTNDSSGDQFKIICDKIEKMDAELRRWRKNCDGSKKASEENEGGTLERMETELKELLRRNLEAQNEIDNFGKAKHESLKREKTFLKEVEEREREYKNHNEQLLRHIELLSASLLDESRKCVNLSLESRHLEGQLRDSKNANWKLEEKTRDMIAELRAIVRDHEKLNERLNKERNFLKNAAVKLSDEIENMEKELRCERKAKDELDARLRKERSERLNANQIDAEREKFENVNKSVEENLEKGKSNDLTDAKNNSEKSKVGNLEDRRRTWDHFGNEGATLKPNKNANNDPSDVRITELFREFCEYVSEGEARRIVFSDQTPKGKGFNLAQIIPKCVAGKTDQTLVKSFETQFTGKKDWNNVDPARRNAKNSRAKAEKLREVTEDQLINVEKPATKDENTPAKINTSALRELYDVIGEHVNTGRAKGILIESEPLFAYPIRVKEDPLLKDIVRDLAQNDDYVVSQIRAQTDNSSDLISDEARVTKLFREICNQIATGNEKMIVILTGDGECFVITSGSKPIELECVSDEEDCPDLSDQNYDCEKIIDCESGNNCDEKGCGDLSSGQGIRDRIIAKLYDAFMQITSINLY